MTPPTGSAILSPTWLLSSNNWYWMKLAYSQNDRHRGQRQLEKVNLRELLLIWLVVLPHRIIHFTSAYIWPFPEHMGALPAAGLWLFIIFIFKRSFSGPLGSKIVLVIKVIDKAGPELCFRLNSKKVLQQDIAALKSSSKCCLLYRTL